MAVVRTIALPRLADVSYWEEELRSGGICTVQDQGLRHWLEWVLAARSWVANAVFPSTFVEEQRDAGISTRFVLYGQLEPQEWSSQDRQLGGFAAMCKDVDLKSTDALLCCSKKALYVEELE